MGLLLRRSLVPIVFGAVLAVSQPIVAQIPWPERGSNLRVLPPDTSTAQLRKTMFDFCNALGVNCIYCHQTEDRNDWSRYDFASDEKATKRTARVMLQMVRSINATHLAKLPERGAEALEVRCETCHRGTSIPESIERRIGRVLRKEGSKAAIDDYRQLRDRYAGGTAFYFGPGPLNVLGYELLEEERIDDAIAIFRLSVEEHPQDANASDSLAEAYMKAGKPLQAIAHYMRALQLDPTNENAARMLAELYRGLPANPLEE